MIGKILLWGALLVGGALLLRRHTRPPSYTLDSGAVARYFAEKERKRAWKRENEAKRMN